MPVAVIYSQQAVRQIAAVGKWWRENRGSASVVEGALDERGRV